MRNPNKLRNPNRLRDPNAVKKKKCPACGKMQLVETSEGLKCGNCNYENKKELWIKNAEEI